MQKYNHLLYNYHFLIHYLKLNSVTIDQLFAKFFSKI